jgi:hypothetical protein
MTARDVASVGFYGLIFASVVLWAAHRAAEDASPASRGAMRAYSSIQPLERSEALPEIRRVVQHMIVR